MHVAGLKYTISTIHMGGIPYLRILKRRIILGVILLFKKLFNPIKGV